MYFTISEKDAKFFGELLYIEDECSLYFKPNNNNAGVSIMCAAYTSLDTICETREVVHISGLNSQHLWIPRNLKIPKAIKGKLMVHFEEPPLKGTGVDYDRSWQTFYDEELRSLCIGNPEITSIDDTIEFANGIIAVLRENQLIAIWAKIRILEKMA